MALRLAVVAIVFFSVCQALAKATLGKEQQRLTVEAQRLQPRGTSRPEMGKLSIPPNAEAEDPLKDAAIRRMSGITGAANLREKMIVPIIEWIRTIIAAEVPPNNRQKFVDEFSEEMRARLRFHYRDCPNLRAPFFIGRDSGANPIL